MADSDDSYEFVKNSRSSSDSDDEMDVEVEGDEVEEPSMSSLVRDKSHPPFAHSSSSIVSFPPLTLPLFLSLVFPSSPQEHKELGNRSYKSGDYRTAISHYTDALSPAYKGSDDQKTRASYHGNRAAAYMMILMYEDAIADCDEAIALDQTNPKVSK